MKKNIVFVILILCASWMNGQDWDTGGNVLTGGEVLGSTNDFDLDVHRNSLLRILVPPSDDAEPAQRLCLSFMPGRSTID